MFSEPLLSTRPELVRARDHLLAADAAYVLLLIKRKKAWNILKEVLALPHPARHEDLDSLGTARAVNQVRSLFVDLGVLPERDEYLHRLYQWIRQQTAAQPQTSDRLVLHQFIRWCQQRRLRSGPITNTQAANDKRELRLVFSFLNHVNADQQTIRTASQQHINTWALSASRDAFKIRSFIRWCAVSGTNRSLTAPDYPHLEFQIGGSLGPENEAALERALTDKALDPRLALAALLTVAYGVRVHRIAALRLDGLTVSKGSARIRLGSIGMELPAAATPWVRAVLNGATIRRRFGGSNQDSTWVFPGARHGAHQLPSSLAASLRRLGITPAGAHQASSAAIIAQVPPAVAARILGVDMTTAAHWYKLVGQTPSPGTQSTFAP
ncbi:hypothetical protein ACX80T_10100 [Arthrobacter sp. Sr33]